MSHVSLKGRADRNIRPVSFSKTNTITYDKGEKVTSVYDKVRNVLSSYSYDDVDTLKKITTVKVNNIMAGNNIEEYEYNDFGAISKITYSGEVTRTVNYTYEDTSKMRLTKLFNGAHSLEYGYDSLGRNNNKILKVNNVEVCKQTIAYTAGLNCTTTMPSKISYNDGSSIAYTYDELSNIKKITANNKSVDYTYDKFGRLIREDNQELDKSYIYSYDNNGNITKKETYDYTKAVAPSGTATVINYTYNGNKLTSFGSESCEYDNIGNPKIYRGKAATWKDRQLQSYDGVTFGYDGLGRRMSKTVNGKKTEYSYDSDDKLLKSSDGMEYFYDETGVISFKYNGELYIYKKDIQGNIIAILDKNGNVVVEYKYDAWGSHTVSGSNITLGNLNPFRYRSYFYDTETKLYFLQSRYYDPAVGRFLNMDNTDYADPESIDGLNLYVYCGNNPVMNVDPNGTFGFAIAALAVLLFTPIGGIVVQTAASAASYVGMAVASIWDKDIRKDMNAIGWNPFNSDESVVLSSSKVSFYKGAPVFRGKYPSGRSGTFLGIFLDESENDIDTVRHEWGHIAQQMMMGPGTYGITVGIPSPLMLGPWAKNGNYYGAPWETLADILGGVQSRTHSKTEITRAWLYYSVSLLCPPAAFLFLLWK